LWGQKIYPKRVNYTHPSRNEYYHIEGVAGVRLAREKERSPYDWTTDSLMKDFQEFQQEAFLVAHKLDGSVTMPSP